MKMWNHDLVVCRKCGSKEWELFKDPRSGEISSKCANPGCGHSVFLGLPVGREKPHMMKYFTQRDKRLEDLMPGDIPPGLDPDQVALPDENILKL